MRWPRIVAALAHAVLAAAVCTVLVFSVAGCSLLPGDGGSGGKAGGEMSDGKGKQQEEAEEPEPWREALLARLKDREPGFVYSAAGDTKDVIAEISCDVDNKVRNWPSQHPLAYVALKPDGSQLWVTPLSWQLQKGVLRNPLLIYNVAKRKVIATIQAKQPGQVAFTPDGSRALVSLTGGNEVAVYDTSTRKVIKRITVGKHPFGIAVSFDGARAYVAHVSTVVSSRTSASVPGVGKIFVPKLEGGSEFVAVIDLASYRVVGRVPIGGFGAGVAVSPDGRIVYATASSIDVSRVTPGFAKGAKGRWDGIAVINTSSLKVIRKIKFAASSGVKDIAFTPDGKKVYAICGATDQATPIDVATHTARRGIPLGLGG